jgi:hypothetical protein
MSDVAVMRPLSSSSDADPISPQVEQSARFVAYAAPWEPIPDDGLPRYSGPPPGD